MKRVAIITAVCLACASCGAGLHAQQIADPAADDAGTAPASRSGSANRLPDLVPVDPPRTAPTAPRADSVPGVDELLSGLIAAERQNNGDRVVYSYGQAVRDPELARSVLSHLMTDYYALRGKAQSAMQASQAVDEASLRLSLFRAAQNQVTVLQNQTLVQQHQRLIEQNQQMITLLEQIARKR